jgi:cation:H+ antiporter
LSKTGDREAAQSFLKRALANPDNRPVHVLSRNGLRSYPAAVRELQRVGQVRRGCRQRTRANAAPMIPRLYHRDVGENATLLASLMLLSGLVLLYIGAEWLVKGAAGLGRSFGVRPLVVGLTVVAYGTSAPELVVSGMAALEGRSAIALANVIGSNIANIGLVLGLSAVIAPMQVEGGLIRRELPVLLGTTLLMPILLATGGVTRPEAAVLLLVAAGFTFLAARVPPRELSATPALVEADAEAAGAPPGRGRLRLLVIAAVGLGILLAGGQVFVQGAVSAARALGLSDRIIGLTIVAMGTSAPELAASIVAATRGHSAIAVGNVIGSNIFNVVFVLAGAALVSPIVASLTVFAIDVAVLSVFSIAATVMTRRKRVIGRLEGLVLLASYAGYLLSLTLAA